MSTRAGRGLARRSPLAVAAIVLLLGLNGCSAPVQIAVRVVDGDLAFSVCQRAAANRIEVSTYADSSNAEEPTLIWGATGATGTHDSVTFTANELPGQSTLDSKPAPLDLSGHRLYLHYDLDRDSVAQSGLFASWDGDEVSSEYWLAADGQRHEQWCEDGSTP